MRPSTYSWATTASLGARGALAGTHAHAARAARAAEPGWQEATATETACANAPPPTCLREVAPRLGALVQAYSGFRAPEKHEDTLQQAIGWAACACHVMLCTTWCPCRAPRDCEVGSRRQAGHRAKLGGPPRGGQQHAAGRWQCAPLAALQSTAQAHRTGRYHMSGPRKRAACAIHALLFERQ